MAFLDKPSQALFDKPSQALGDSFRIPELLVAIVSHPEAAQAPYSPLAPLETHNWPALKSAKKNDLSTGKTHCMEGKESNVDYLRKPGVTGNVSGHARGDTPSTSGNTITGKH